jgi:hypothetical protein
MNITLEELRNEWSDRSRRLDEHLRLSAHLLRDDWIERRRERLWKLGPFGKFSMAVWIATMVMLGHFLGTHANQPALFVTALVLDVWVIAASIAEVRQQQALRNLDFGLSLIELQAQVEALRIARIRSFNRVFLTGQIVWWIPFVVVVFAGAFGVNLYLSPQFRAFAAWNIAGGIAFIPLAMWLSRRYGERLSRSSIVRHIADSIAGRDIAAAREYLEKLRRFGSGAD